MDPGPLPVAPEIVHRFQAYPPDHAVTAPICIRCGRERKHPNHVGRRPRMNWKRLMNRNRDWKVWG